MLLERKEGVERERGRERERERERERLIGCLPHIPSGLRWNPQPRYVP